MHQYDNSKTALKRPGNRNCENGAPLNKHFVNNSRSLGYD